MTSQKKDGPSLTADLRRGDETQVEFALQQLGVLPDHFAAIGKPNNIDLAQVIADLLITRSMFSTPQVQFARMLEMNNAVWKDPEITKDSINSMAGKPLCPPHSLPEVRMSGPDCLWRPDSGLYCATLIYETGDPIQTFLRNWAGLHHVLKCIFGDNLIGEPTPGSVNTDAAARFSWDAVEVDSIQLRAGVKPRPKGFYWIVTELGRRQGNSLQSIQNSEEIVGIGNELPMIAAMHPEWFLKSSEKDEDRFPTVAAPNIEILDRKKCVREIPYMYLFTWDVERDNRNEKPLQLLNLSAFQSKPMRVHYGTIIKEGSSTD